MGDGSTYWRPRWLVELDPSGSAVVTERGSCGDVLAHMDRPAPHVHMHEAFDPAHTQPRVLRDGTGEKRNRQASQFLDDYSSRGALEEALGSPIGHAFLREALDAGAAGANRAFRLHGRYTARFVFRSEGVVRTSALGTFAAGVFVRLYGVSDTMAYVQTMFPLDELSLASMLTHQ